MVCEEFCHLFSSVAENLNLEHSTHVISIRGSVKTRGHVMVRQTSVLLAPVSMQCLNTLYLPLQVNKGKSRPIIQLPYVQTNIFIHSPTKTCPHSGSLIMINWVEVSRSCWQQTRGTWCRRTAAGHWGPHAIMMMYSSSFSRLLKHFASLVHGIWPRAKLWHRRFIKSLLSSLLSQGICLWRQLKSTEQQNWSYPTAFFVMNSNKSSAW